MEEKTLSVQVKKRTYNEKEPRLQAEMLQVKHREDREHSHWK
jgi:hypothetical protein